MSDETPKHYHIVVDDLDSVIKVNHLKKDDFYSFYEDLATFIKEEKLTETSEIIQYKAKVCFSLVDGLVIEEEEFDSVVDSIYEGIMEVYPIFRIEDVCNTINIITQIDDDKYLGVEGLRAYLKEHFSTSTKEKGKEKEEATLTNADDLERVRKALSDKIIGQDKAIDAVIDALKIKAAGLSDQTSMFFIGPTGVGKTELSRALSETAMPNFCKINCSEYSSHHEYAKLIGSPPGYIGHGESSILKDKANQSDSWVFLFDEIEKAHHKLFDVLLSLLDDGTCTDSTGKVLDFTKSIFIFTSNLGMKELEVKVGFTPKLQDQNERVQVVQEEVRKFFNPEFIGRIDNFVHFKKLGKKDIEKIARQKLTHLPLNVTNSLVKFVVEKGYSEEYGARHIEKFIKKNVSPCLADAILSGLEPTSDTGYYDVRVTKGGLKVINAEAA